MPRRIAGRPVLIRLTPQRRHDEEPLTPEPAGDNTVDGAGHIRGVLGRLIGDSLASKIVGTSTITFLLGGAAWEWQTGYDEGIANRRGVAIDYIRGSSDLGATPFQIVALLLIASFALAAVATLLPMFTSWHIPGIVGVYEVLRGIFPALDPHDAHRWFHLVTGAVLIGFAGVVELTARALQRMIARRRERPSLDRRWLTRYRSWISRNTNLRLSRRADAFVTFAQVSFVLSLAAFVPLTSSVYLGRWMGSHAAQPNQAVIIGGQTYVWLGTTDNGLIAARLANFCGEVSPEEARTLLLNGSRSTLIDSAGAVVVKLSEKLQLVRRCP